MSQESGHPILDVSESVLAPSRVFSDGVITRMDYAIKKPQDNGFGYMRVRHGGRSRMVHELVWEAFRGKKPAGLQINHINGNKRDNCLSNLELVTPSQNSAHAWRTGLITKSPRKRRNLTIQQARAIVGLGMSGIPRKEIARSFGVCLACVRHIQNGINHAN